MFIKVKPYDTLFFRSGRPFSAGSDTWADTVFPPSPSTFYGAIRSFLIFAGGSLEKFYLGTHEYRDIIGYKSDTKLEYGSLMLKGIYLKDNELIFFPNPFDLVKNKKENKELYKLKFEEKSKLFISNYQLKHYLIWQKNEQADEPEGWLDINEFQNYLENKESKFSCLSNDNFFAKEQKIGISKDRTTFVSKESYLYRIPFIRMKEDTCFLIEIEGVDNNIFSHFGVFQLGGEGKAVKYEILSGDPLENLRNLDFNFANRYFKLYFATPAVFKNGWFPSWIHAENEYKGSYKGIELQLVACTVGKPISIGGWDLANNKPKPLRKAIPAGSVYYFEILNNLDSERLKKTFHFQNISDDFDDIKYSQEGFGLSILGEV